MPIASRDDRLNLHLIEPLPVKEIDNFLGRLPNPLTSFIGREEEVAALRKSLLNPKIRLTCLIGPGGVGKTRLAIRVAETLQEQFEDGVWFVPLALVRDPSLVGLAIAQSIGARRSAGSPIERSLMDFVRDRELLLILDNFEHLLSAGPLIAGLLNISGQSTALVTSRSVLHLSGEHDVQVQPLDVPTSDGDQSPEFAIQSPAVRLFVERAGLALSTFEMTGENTGSVIAICQRLDGLPLAIELAAARVATLPPSMLLDRLEPRLPMLTGGALDQPDRLQTMRNAIAWSYQLLSQDEQTLLRRLAVFVGGSTVEAAEAIGSGDSQRSTIDGIGKLVEQSLLRRTGSDAAPRLSMLEVIREFALEELQTSGEMEHVQRQHATYFLSLVKELTPGLSGADMVTNLSLLEGELPNIRSALNWALKSGQVETALRLGAALYPFWNYRGHLAEGRAWLTQILGRREASFQSRIDGLLATSALAALQGDYSEANTACEEASALAQNEEYAFGLARARLLTALIAEWTGNFTRAAGIYAQSLTNLDDFGEDHWRSRILALQSEMDVVLGAAGRAEERANEAVSRARESDHVWNLGIATGVLAYLALERKDYAAAASLYAENLERYRRLGDRRGMGGAIAGFAGIASANKKEERAARLLGAARAVGDEAGVGHLANKALSDSIDASVRSTMSPRAFEMARDAGYALGLDWALAETKAVASEILGRRASSHPRVVDESGLTNREIEVIYLLERRLTDREIADALSISPRTAMSHVASIRSKLGLNNRREVTAWAREHELT